MRRQTKAKVYFKLMVDVRFKLFYKLSIQQHINIIDITYPFEQCGIHFPSCKSPSSLHSVQASNYKRNRENILI